MTIDSVPDLDPPAPGRTRRNRGSEVVRHALIDAAIGEFAAHGFEGASTRAIAEAAGAHQSQIKDPFDNTDELWRRCLERLLGEVDAAIAEASAVRAGPDGGQRAIDVLEATIRGLVRFAARRPELNRIMVHEATSPSDRLTWLVETRLGRRQAEMAEVCVDWRPTGWWRRSTGMRSTTRSSGRRRCSTPTPPRPGSWGSTRPIPSWSNATQTHSSQCSFPALRGETLTPRSGGTFFAGRASN